MRESRHVLDTLRSFLSQLAPKMVSIRCISLSGFQAGRHSVPYQYVFWDIMTTPFFEDTPPAAVNESNLTLVTFLLIKLVAARKVEPRQERNQRAVVRIRAKMAGRLSKLGCGHQRS
jgi:hypothetical protein